ncbi:MAG TPA: hypothetical protein DEQ43_00025 [Nocardioides bacterium]|nr:hypothetical protein [Nocardioides sp.]
MSAPLPRDTHLLLRRAVHDHAREALGRRDPPPVLHVGVPGGRTASLPLDPAEPADLGLRTDVVAALRVRAGPETGADASHLVWLSRSGELVLQDLDALWLSAARAAYIEAERELIFVVVNRHGWRDPRSGLGRTWARVRANKRRQPASGKDTA